MKTDYLSEILKIPHRFTYWEVYLVCIPIFCIFLIYAAYKSRWPFDHKLTIIEKITTFILWPLYWSLFLALVALIPSRYLYDNYHNFEYKKGAIYKEAAKPLYNWCNQILNDVNAIDIYSCMTSKTARKKYLLSSNAIKKDIKLINKVYENIYRKKNKIYKKIPKEYLLFLSSKSLKGKLLYSGNYFKSDSLKKILDNSENSIYIPDNLEQGLQDNRLYLNDVWLGLSMKTYNADKLAKDSSQEFWDNYDPKAKTRIKEGENSFLMPLLPTNQNIYIYYFCKASISYRDDFYFSLKANVIRDDFSIKDGCKIDISYFQEINTSKFQIYYNNLIKGFKIKSPIKYIYNPLNNDNVYEKELTRIENKTLKSFKNIKKSYKLPEFFRLIIDDIK